MEKFLMTTWNNIDSDEFVQQNIDQIYVWYLSEITIKYSEKQSFYLE